MKAEHLGYQDVTRGSYRDSLPSSEVPAQTESESVKKTDLEAGDCERLKVLLILVGRFIFLTHHKSCMKKTMTLTGSLKFVKF